MGARVEDQRDASDAILRLDVIYARAKELGISKGDLAAQAGINHSTLWRYGHGTVPSWPIVQRICEILGLTEDEVDARDGRPTAPPPSGPSTPPPPSGPKGGVS